MLVSRLHLLLSFVLPALPLAAQARVNITAPRTLSIRLTSPVTTWSGRPGDLVHAVLTQPVTCGPEVLLPAGSLVTGVIHSRHKVGWGIHHETATLDLEWTSVTPPGSRPIPLLASVTEVENARESLHHGTIQGIRSSNTFQGTINSSLIHLPTWAIYSDPIVAVFKVAFPIFPEPEIFYPAGTDLEVRSTIPLELTWNVTSAPAKRSDNLSDANLQQLVNQLPWRVETRDDVPADIVNLVFLGTRDEIMQAFHLAGWNTADPVSHHAVAKNFYALLNNDGYPRQPMRTFFLDGRPEDMDWQKSLNSYGRRDHLRIWGSSIPDPDATSNFPNSIPRTASSLFKEPLSTPVAVLPNLGLTPVIFEQGRATVSSLSDHDLTPPSTVWISTSTHDTGAVLAVRYHGFVHHIAPDVDQERDLVLRDLTFAGCVRASALVPRPSFPTTARNSIGDPMHTDGAVAVVSLQPCRPANPDLQLRPDPTTFRPGNHAFRFFRRLILTARSDIWRANIIYGAYDLGRITVSAFHPRPAPTPNLAQPQAIPIPTTPTPISPAE